MHLCPRLNRPLVVIIALLITPSLEAGDTDTADEVRDVYRKLATKTSFDCEVTLAAEGPSAAYLKTGKAVVHVTSDQESDAVWHAEGEVIVAGKVTPFRIQKTSNRIAFRSGASGPWLIAEPGDFEAIMTYEPLAALIPLELISPDEFLSMAKSEPVRWLEPRRVDGAECRVLACGRCPSRSDAFQRAYVIGREDNLLRQILITPDGAGYYDPSDRPASRNVMSLRIRNLESKTSLPAPAIKDADAKPYRPPMEYLIKTGRFPGLGKPLPEFDLVDFDGTSHTAQRHRGRILVLDFWATWCGPCIASLPRMDKMCRELADGGVTLLGVNVMERGDPVQKIKSLKLAAPQLSKGDELLETLGVKAIPLIIVVDKKGIVRGAFVGGSESTHSEIESLVKALIKEG